jgi:catechol 2,3-dioxygenase-like lactoylglutathione lyase family enzyme
MLGNFSVHTTIPAKDLDRARRFYADKLGFQPTQELPGGLVYESGDSWFLLYPTQAAGTAEHTLMGWQVDDIEQAVKTLRGKGVKFEEYNYPNLKTVNGIAEMDGSYAAWFKDSEGNILGLIQMG